MQLAILHEALKLVSAEEMGVALAAQRTGIYLRKAAFLWEKAHGELLPLPWDSTGGNYVDLLDRGAYYTGPNWERSARLRVNFNGIGPYAICPVVRRDDALARRGQQVLTDVGGQPALLPLSVAMKHHEKDDLAALQHVCCMFRRTRR